MSLENRSFVAKVLYLLIAFGFFTSFVGWLLANS